MEKFLMTSDNTHSKQRSSTKAIYRFLGGSAVGTLVLLIPITYGTLNDVRIVQVGVLSLLVILCGLLSIAWGEKFIDGMMRMLNNTGL
jgi:hypothetical protein